MQSYKLYLFEADGRQYDVIDIEADSNSAAIQMVEEHFQRQAMKLTQGKRTIESYPTAAQNCFIEDSRGIAVPGGR